jgi:tRNA-dihydrouridine synthase B
MIGRGALDNPWIFAQIADAAAGRVPRAPSAEDRVAALRLFRDLLEEDLPESAFIGRFRGIACRFVKGMAGSAAARRAIGTARTAEDVEAIFSEFVLGCVRGVDLALAVA